MYPKPRSTQLNTNEQKIVDYINAIVIYFADLRIMPRNLNSYPFDTVALELLSKSVSVVHSCLILIEANQTEEALVLGRTLVEAALILRHLTRDKSSMTSEARKFLSFSYVNKSFWLFQARRMFTNDGVRADIEYHADKWGYRSEKPMAATRTWSTKYNVWKSQVESHPLDGQYDTEAERTTRHAIEYTQTSCYVHCTQPSLDNFFPSQREIFNIKTSSNKFTDSRGILSFICFLLTFIGS